jgi:hypothetical protein
MANNLTIMVNNSTNTNILILKSLYTKRPRHLLIENCLIVNHHCLIVDHHCLVVNHDYLIVDRHCLIVDHHCLIDNKKTCTDHMLSQTWHHRVFVIFLLVIVLSVLPRLTACDYLFGVFWSLCSLYRHYSGHNLWCQWKRQSHSSAHMLMR